MIWLYNHDNSLVQLGDEDNPAEMVTFNEIKGTTNESKWIFEIFHGEYVHGIRQTYDVHEQEVGYTDGEPLRIEMMSGEQVIKVTFSGWDLT